MNYKHLLMGIAAFGAAVAGAGDLKLSMTAKRGLMIQSPLGDVSACSRIIAVEPPWQQKWFWNHVTPCTFTNDTVDNKQAVSTVQAQDDGFKIIDYSAVTDGDSVNIKFKGELSKDVPCNIEYSAINVMDFFLAGATYTADLADGRTISGTIPADERTQEQYITDARKLTFNGKYGELIITVNKGMSLNVVNRRDVTFEGFSCYWIGKHDIPFKYGEVFESDITLQFKPNPDIAIPRPIVAENASAPVEIVPNQELKLPVAAQKLPVMPAIKKQTMLQGELVLGKTFDLDIDFDSDEVEDAEEARLEKAVARLYAKLNASGTEETEIEAVVGAKSDDLVSPEQPDGYAMKITPKGISIVSKSARGVYYAVQTLRSLADNGKIAAQTIVDYPDMEFRGVHLLADEGSLNLHGKMAEDLFGRYKMNKIVYEIEYLAWDSTKNLHMPKAMTKAQLKEFLAICKDNYIDVYPLFQTLGHLEWFFQNGQNLEMAEDPATPYAYNVSHPGVYPIMDNILIEIIEAFDNPEYVHIGHDEVDMIGRYPFQPENIKRGLPDLVMTDIMHYYNFLKARGIKTMMWHDMMMTPKESSNSSGMRIENVKEYRDKLPRDIVIADWNYSGTDTDSQFPCIPLLNSEGFKTLGCTWYETNNIENMAMSVKRAGAWGLLATTWTGYFGSNDSLEMYFHQMAPYLRAAVWAWTASPAANKGLGDFHREFSILTKEIWPEPGVKPGFDGYMLDITPAANIELSAKENPFMNGETYDLDKIFTPGKPNYVGNAAFMIPQINGQTGAVALYSPVNRLFPAEVKINLNPMTADELLFLHANLGSAADFDKAMAYCTVVYEDGSSVEIPFIYGRSLSSIFTPVYSYHMGPECGKEWKTADGRDMSLIYYRWSNPNPAKKIKEIILKPSEHDRPYYLFGISVR